MRDALFDLCRRFADAHVDSSGVAVTPVPGITLVRALHPGDLQAAIARPLVAMLLQGRKSVTTGLASFDYGPGEAMVIAADVATTSQITEASQRFPYYALVLELDLAILRELQEAGPSGPDEAPRVGIEPMNADVTDAAYRLARLFDQPGALAVLGEGLRRELHYWLLQSVHGPAIRALGAVDSHSARIRRAVAMLRRDFMQPVSVDRASRRRRDERLCLSPSFPRHDHAVAATVSEAVTPAPRPPPDAGGRDEYCAGCRGGGLYQRVAVSPGNTLACMARRRAAIVDGKK
ncbi:AraC-type transcriptional regulator N-terminus [Serratia liquefaciens]|nr:AraC-type transcriptional regulator N-terminus [Serratia liquefaciens]